MRVAVIGGVSSTELLIVKLREHGFSDLRVWGYVPADATNVSGWVDLETRCAELGVDYSGFRKVAECEPGLREFAPDVVFAVGLSQILQPSLLGIAARENIGFHPTALPRGRGRGALAWIVLEGAPGAATFFGIREGVDDGPIYVQRTFAVSDADDARSVESKMLQAEADALDAWLPILAAGRLEGKEQDQSAATWYGRRTPDDGWVDWSRPRRDIMKLIRASTRPHPGARSVCGDSIITIWAAEADDRPIHGVVGRILDVQGRSFSVQAGDGLVRIEDWDCAEPWQPKVGALLGYHSEAEILRLRERCAALEQRLDSLVAQIEGSRQ